MRVRSVLLGAVLVAVPVTVTAAPAAAAPSTVAAASPCRPGTPPVAPPTTEFFDAARPELGPAVLPASPLLFFYKRFGNLTADQFHARYRSGSSWVYPPADGFLVIAGKTIKYRQKLTAGSRIDRYGYSGGSYLAPARTLFAQRALPPQSLNTPVGTPRSNYHLYCVLVPFDVSAGPIAPWFEQPGLGFQYKLEASYLPDPGGAASVSWLLANGYLVEERPA